MAYTLIPNNNFNKLSKLSGKAIYIYILLRSKLRYSPGFKVSIDNGIVICSYKEAEKRGIHRMAFLRGIKQLVHYKLIEIAEKGVFGGRRPTKYKIF